MIDQEAASCSVHTSFSPPQPHFHTFTGSMSSYSASIAKALVDAGAGAEVIAAVLSPDASISGTAAWALEQVWRSVGCVGDSAWWGMNVFVANFCWMAKKWCGPVNAPSASPPSASPDAGCGARGGRRDAPYPAGCSAAADECIHKRSISIPGVWGWGGGLSPWEGRVPCRLFDLQHPCPSPFVYSPHLLTLAQHSIPPPPLHMTHDPASHERG